VSGVFNIPELRAELDEKSRDLDAFIRARDIVYHRVMEVRDSKSRLTPLPDWSGTDAVLGSLDMAIHAMERTIEELKGLLQQQQAMEKTRLRLVEGGSDGGES
jgi:hypothetical protein